MDNENTGTAAAVAEIVERLTRAEEIAIERDNGHGNVHPNGLLVIPDGKKVVDLREFEDKRLDNPRRRKGTSSHTTLASFLEHIERTKDEGSVVFAADDPKAPSFQAIYDYNEPSEIVTDYSVQPLAKRGGLPRFGQHVARYAMPFSDEWLAWDKIAGPSAPWLSQLDFAQALEDRGLEVLAPTDVPKDTAKVADLLGITAAGPSQLMNLSRGLSVRANRKVGSAVNLNTGEARITFEEEHAASLGDAPVVVPTGFAISCAVFRQGAPYAMLVRLRYKLDGASVKWKLALHRPDAVFRDAFSDVADGINKRTLLPIFFGSPE